MNTTLAHLSRRILPAVLGITVIAGCGGSGGAPAAKGTPSSALPAPSAPATSSSPSPSPSPTPTVTPSGDADPALKPFYGQQIAWSSCPADPAKKDVDMSDFQCGTAHVPLDYGNPGGDTVDLALMRKQAVHQDQRLGSLFLNPGGPGGSGLDLLTNAATSSFGNLNNRYDLIGFDPRGVGKSTAVHCLDDSARDQLDAQDHAGPTSVKDFGAACEAKSGKLLPFVGTVNAARDLDVLRGAVGDQKLNYLGFSYGTYLGTFYANQFPDRTGRLVLDGAMDPSVSPLDGDVAQMVGFEGVYERFAADCVNQSQCPLGSDAGAAAKKAADFLDGLQAHPLTSPTSGRKLTQALGWTGAMDMLYGDAKSWEYLRIGLTQAMQKHQPDLLLAFADDYNGRDQQGHFSNQADANQAINCADDGSTPPTDDQLQQALQQLHAKAPYLTNHMTLDDVRAAMDCADWPVHGSTPPQVLKATGSAPILVVGSTGDDATPYAWAQHLAGSLANATLLTRDGDGHTGYDKSSCIKTAVDAFLIDGTMPAAGTHCPTTAASSGS
ncbi:alpha/beta hydrolase [Kitasatospora kifunensis]|uniref:Pimeloyl-ACP methyl ester carboxylesterase n=1 Tax=Kitasatospora kifunensis TaxID=58351 RepID=A0A7W7QZG3_KITKI|nr:alpha/beta hydrolase [Kitasatospora kifunensis]MBB4922682.1 pimeloyl-ACP methyl ester carboxylesterase [Kitasatospora kifunensis]